MKPVKVIKYFVSKDDANLIIDYIDRNQESFTKNTDLLWLKKFFGLDVLYRAGGCEGIIEGLEDITDLCIGIVENIKTMIAKEYEDIDEIFLNSFWLVKHLPGSVVGEHNDLDNGEDGQFVYSSVLYLNTIEDGGDLEFPNLNLSISTESGDLVMFPSDGEDMTHRVSSIGQDRYTLPMWFTKDKTLELKFAGNRKMSS